MGTLADMRKIHRWSWHAPVWLTIEGLALVVLTIALYRSAEDDITGDTLILFLALGAIGVIVTVIGIVKGVKTGGKTSRAGN